MKAKIRFPYIFGLLALLAFSIPVGLFSVLAQESDETSGVAISPPIIELNLSPGKVIEKQIKLTNPLDHTVTLYPLVYDFVAQGEAGQQSFLPPIAENRTFALSNWISYNRSMISLAQNEEDFLDFTISVPEDAEPGGHYGVIFFSTSPGDVQAQPGQVSVSGMVGSLILARVSGDIHEKAQILEFAAPRYSLDGPIKFVSRIENLGNTHFKPRGTINISNWRGENVQSLELNPSTGNVLPESIRRFETAWKNQGRWGKFTAALSVTYGNSKQTLKGEVVFWIIPWYVILIFGLALVLLIVLAVWLRARRHARKTPPKVEPPVRPKRLIQ